MKKLLLIVPMFFIIQTGCKVPQCVAVEEYTTRFEKNLNVIKNAEEKNEEVLADEYRDALVFLSNVTGIITKAEYAHTIGYNNKGDYQNDMTLWRKWYQQNKCKLNQQYIDSAMSQNNNNRK